MYDIQARTGAAFSFTALDPKKVDKLLKRKWEGSSFSDRIWDNTQHLAETVKDELMLNFLTGRTEDEASKAIMDRYQVGYNQARRLVRTESAYVANEMDADAYEAAGITHYMIVATLDLKTSEICQEMDGKIFLLKEKQVGENFPPFHPWCRSTTVESDNPEKLKNMKRRARDPETGKNYIVPAGTTYKEWRAGLEEKYGKQQVKKWENVEKGRSKKVTGARITDPDSKEAEMFAEQYYEEIRHMKNDVARIADNTGHSIDEIQKIKDYLFINKSLFDEDTGEWRRFDEDARIAQSWQRLLINNGASKIKKHDITLINHELLEMKLKEENPNISHYDAHIQASMVYNYAKEADKYYARLEKHRKKG